MRPSSLHIAALLSPAGVHSSIVQVQWYGVRQRQRQAGKGDFSTSLDRSNQQNSKALDTISNSRY